MLLNMEDGNVLTQVNKRDYQKLLDCVFSSDINVCEDVPSGGGRKGGAKLTNPLGGTAHQVDGADRCECAPKCEHTTQNTFSTKNQDSWSKLGFEFGRS